MPFGQTPYSLRPRASSQLDSCDNVVREAFATQAIKGPVVVIFDDIMQDCCYLLLKTSK